MLVSGGEPAHERGTVLWQLRKLSRPGGKKGSWRLGACRRAAGMCVEGRARRPSKSPPLSLFCPPPSLSEACLQTLGSQGGGGAGHLFSTCPRSCYYHNSSDRPLSSPSAALVCVRLARRDVITLKTHGRPQQWDLLLRRASFG